MRIAQRIFAILLALLTFLGPAPLGWAGSAAPPVPTAPPAADTEPAGSTGEASEATPPRISYIHGEVSLWRPGATDWTPATLNMPLAPGDVLYAGPAGNVEIQIGARAFARAAYGTQLGLDNQEPDFIQLRATSGYAALDLRELAPGHTVELATPGAAFTVDRTGYYHAEIGPDATVFRTYRGGTATVIPSGGSAAALATNQQMVITSADSPRAEATEAPALTAWDRWNHQRSDYLAQPASARHLSAGVYGGETLDQHGTWRSVESYGTVWVPTTVAPGWSPYSTGRWIWDPRFGWTWLDDAPWGWAPYHYGRWVFVRSYWAWAPGPVVVRPVYAPALVVFLGGPVVVGRPVYWAPLGWGEPVIRWWGPPRLVGVAWWGGWGGPRVVNNVVVSRRTTVNVTNITVYRNVNVTNAVVGVPADRFGQGTARPARLTDRAEAGQVAPVRGAPDVRPVAASLAPEGAAAARPPDAVRSRPVVTTRAPQDPSPTLRAQGLATAPAAAPQPQQRIVPAPVRATPPPAAAAPGSAAPPTGSTRRPGGPGRAAPEGSQPRSIDRGSRPPTPPDAGSRAPAPPRPAETPSAPAVSPPAPRSAPAPTTPPTGQPSVARPAPPAPPSPQQQGAPTPRVGGDSRGQPGARQTAPAERSPRGEPQGQSAPERGGADRGGPDRGPRSDR